MKTSLPTMLSCALALGACADEGLWLFNQPPRELLRERVNLLLARISANRG